MQNFTLHTHTIGFDGKSTVAQMITAARAAGFDTLGVSNHFIVHPEIKKSRMYPYAVRGGYSAIYSDSFDSVIEKFRIHYNELRQLQSESQANILCGMEVDFFPRVHGVMDSCAQSINCGPITPSVLCILFITMAICAICMILQKPRRPYVIKC